MGGLVGGVLVVMAMLELAARAVGYPIVACGCAVLAYAGVEQAANRNGFAEQAARQFWSDQGITVPNALFQARMMGVGMVVIGAGGALVVLSQAFG